MRRPMIAPELVLAGVSFAFGAMAFAGERAPGGASGRPVTAQDTATEAGAQRVNPTRRLEAEIEDYPVPAAVTDDAATRIPEVLENPARRPAAPLPARPASAAREAIDPAQVQLVLGKSATLVSLSELDAAQVTLLQQRLRERGFYLGVIDGIAGPATRAAVQALLRERFTFQRRLLERGQVTSELAELVGVTGLRAP